MIEAATEKKLKSTNFDIKFFKAKSVPNMKVPAIFNTPIVKLA
jgi:hypothetical protein